MDDPGVFERLTELLVERRTTDRTLVIGITGSVAVGKSTFAARLAESLAVRLPSSPVEVVASDSFLFPNSVLVERGLVLRKGFPESFDVEALAGFLRGVRAGDAELSIPVYDHFIYDIVDGARQRVAAPAILIIEGLALLGDASIEHELDLSIYLDADVQDIEGWYTHRFVEHALRAADEPGGFWDLFSGLDTDQLRDSALFTWTAINLPNYLDHVAPVKDHADVVITKAADHSLTGISSSRNDGGEGR